MPDRISFSQPRPRPAKTAAELADVRVKNRRRAYLDRTPGYFESSEHEFADPLLYHTLIRRFQRPEEMRAEAQNRGFARVLEASLLRGEERLSRLADENTTGASSVSTAATPHTRDHLKALTPTPIEAEILEAPSVENKEEALEMWQTFLKERFIRGGDEDFGYATVDDNDEFDLIERMDREEAWYDDEDPEWASDDDDSPHNGDGGNRRGKVERMLDGETGVQDY
ncbi:putative coiled-coil domain-protein [Rhypophila decipiens]|uniref:Coiled-coil domain-protein n=1 Tax=Rhypophila decipiens TaxID=261697 RepID=A0AAN6YAT7_9PEZI|nr:putative coiled-coil domain-protein [Rhypophila decipiens]